MRILDPNMKFGTLNRKGNPNFDARTICKKCGNKVSASDRVEHYRINHKKKISAFKLARFYDFPKD
jgi:non-homologous end joining protein Ku